MEPLKLKRRKQRTVKLKREEIETWQRKRENWNAEKTNREIEAWRNWNVKKLKRDKGNVKIETQKITKRKFRNFEKISNFAKTTPA